MIVAGSVIATDGDSFTYDCSDGRAPSARIVSNGTERGFSQNRASTGVGPDRVLGESGGPEVSSQNSAPTGVLPRQAPTGVFKS
mgnify:CR=1 FL=1